MLSKEGLKTHIDNIIEETPDIEFPELLMEINYYILESNDIDNNTLHTKTGKQYLFNAFIYNVTTKDVIIAYERRYGKACSFSREMIDFRNEFTNSEVIEGAIDLIIDALNDMKNKKRFMKRG